MLQGKRALITGCNRGIGRTILEEFAKEGADVCAFVRNKTEQFEQELQELSSRYQVKLTPYSVELSDFCAVKEAVRAIFQENNRMDILVNNAGVGYQSLFSLTPMEKLEQIYRVNTFAPMYLTQLCMKKMLKNKGGAVITMASVQGMDSSAGNCAYGSSKAALISFTRCLAAEVAPFGIRVNAIAPGGCDTEILDTLSESERDYLIQKSASSRLAQPKEIARVACFLASEDASFVNGQVIRVDGGGR